LEFSFPFAPAFAILDSMKSPLAKRARVNRKVISIVGLRDDSGRLRHWLRQSPMKRLEGLELLRQSAHAYDPVTARLPRFLTVARRKRG
jgi:hypothetical protein